MAVLLAVPAAAQDDEPGYFFAVKRYELEPVEVPEAGVSLAWPADWPLEAAVLEAEHRLPPEYDDVENPTAWILIRGKSVADDWCRLTSFEDHPMSLEEQAAYNRDSLVREGTEEDRIDISSWMVGDGLAQRTTVTAGDYETMQTYLFETEGVRFDLTCYSYFGENPSWLEMADSVRPLGGRTEPAEPEPEPIAPDVDVQRAKLDARVVWIELPRAGLAMTLPRRWQVIPQDAPSMVALGPPDARGHEVTVWRTLQASFEDRYCRVYAYDDMPLSLDDHAEWLSSEVLHSQASRGPGSPGAPEIEHVESIDLVEQVELPVGSSVRLIAQSQFAGDVEVIYLFDLDGQRRSLACGGPTLPSKAWLSTARTLQPLDGLPAGTIATTEAHDLETMLPVTDVQHETYMHALCDEALWIEFADGTFEERLTCRLTDEPVEPRDVQGTLPREWTAFVGGACEWVSDYWAVTDGSDVWASSWSVTVEPDGSATAISRYAAEELDCEG